VKKPGERLAVEMRELDLVYMPQGDALGPYDRLLGDAMVGDPTLFARQDAVEAAWAVVDPILDAEEPPLGYAPGTWGPRAAEALAAGVGGWDEPGPHG
jgi:glucose-6-phosphate 1-dehydrogenase